MISLGSGVRNTRQGVLCSPGGTAICCGRNHCTVRLAGVDAEGVELVLGVFVVSKYSDFVMGGNESSTNFSWF